MPEDTPEKIIFSTIEGLQVQPDMANVNTTTDLNRQLASLWHKNEARLQAEVETLENELQSTLAGLEALKRPTREILENLHLDEKYINSRPNSAALDTEALIDEQTTALDLEKITLAKQLSEIDTALVQLKAAEVSLDDQLADLEQQKNVALAPGKRVALEPTPMKIMLFRKLGMHIEDADPENGNENDKILIHSEASDSAKVLDVDPKFSDYFISNFIWDNVDRSGEDF